MFLMDWVQFRRPVSSRVMGQEANVRRALYNTSHIHFKNSCYFVRFINVSCRVPPIYIVGMGVLQYPSPI